MDITRNCKVISLYLGERRRWPLGTDGMLSVVSKIIEAESNIDPGIDLDTILVINKSNHPYEADLLKLDETETKRGRWRVIQRENGGLSYGAYNEAFERFRSEYDYWFFIEDDIIPNKDGYYLAAKNDLDGSPKVAFVAAVGIGEKWGKHAYGGVGLTHISYLEEAYKVDGRLPYHPGNINISESRKSKESSKNQVIPHLKNGEVAFTNIYQKLGYKIVLINMKGAMYNLDVTTSFFGPVP